MNRLDDKVSSRHETASEEMGDHFVRSILRGRRAGLFVLVIGTIMGIQACTGRTPPAPSGEIDLKVVKYDQFVEAIKAQRGKVVVVDVWSVF